MGELVETVVNQLMDQNGLVVIFVTYRLGDHLPDNGAQRSGANFSLQYNCF